MTDMIFFTRPKFLVQITLILALLIFSLGIKNVDRAQAAPSSDQDMCGQLLADAEARFLSTLAPDGSVPVNPEVKAAALEYMRVSKLCYDEIEAQNAAAGLQAATSSTPIDDGGVMLGNPSSAQFVLTGNKWGSSGMGTAGGTVTYSFMGNGKGLSAEDPNIGTSVAISSLPGFQVCFVTEIQNAFAAWQAVSNIQFVQVADSGTAFDASGASGDIRIGAHRFDGPSGSLAHAYFPPPNGVSAAGDVHFDSQENWTCGSGGTNIGVVAMHEIGHSLGLNHENTATVAIMDPYYNPNMTALQQDDINGAVAIYGPSTFSALTAPVNDNFVNAFQKTVASIPYTDANLDTTGATIEPNDPTVPVACDNKMLYRGNNTVWYKYSPLINQAVYLDTLGTDYDTYIAVWTGGSLSNLTFIGCDDDTSSGFESQMILDAQAGQTYYIEIAGYAGTQSNPRPNINLGGLLQFHVGNNIPASWAGSVVVTSNRNLVAVGRPHIGDQIMTYDGLASGSPSMYVPMLFNGSFDGSYNSAFYVQNVNGSNPASITIKFYDSQGTLNCTLNDTVSALASKGYWVPSVPCSPALPPGWVGGVVITSTQNIVAVGRPHIGAEVTTYNGFPSGSLSMYVPMLFSGSFDGSYNSALYVQNVAGAPATVTIKFYSATNGGLSCTLTDTINPLASKGYWVPSVPCSPALPSGWYGGVVITSTQNIVAVGRPHIGAEVTTYNGFPSGSLSMYVPMLFSQSFDGTYNSALYVQNVNASSAATVSIKFYNSLTGHLDCTMNDTISPLASKGYWVPSAVCSPAVPPTSPTLPPGWYGSVVVTSNQNIVAVGRPHIGVQIASYDGFTAGASSSYVPMLFKNMWGSYNSAFYLQNVETGGDANVTMHFYDVDGNLMCSRTDVIPPLASLGYWVPTLACNS
jgi:hypothetical protein